MIHKHALFTPSVATEECRPSWTRTASMNITSTSSKMSNSFQTYCDHDFVICVNNKDKRSFTILNSFVPMGLAVVAIAAG